MSAQVQEFVIPAGAYVEEVHHPRVKHVGLLRIWARHSRRDTALLAASCRDCRQLVETAQLVPNKACIGGYSLQCRNCWNRYMLEYSKTPRGAEAAKRTNARWTGTAEKRQSAQRTRAALSLRTPDQIRAAQARLRPDGEKHCPACNSALPLSSFGVATGQPDGLQGYCRDCASRKQRERPPYRASHRRA